MALVSTLPLVIFKNGYRIRGPSMPPGSTLSCESLHRILRQGQWARPLVSLHIGTSMPAISALHHSIYLISIRETPRRQYCVVVVSFPMGWLAAWLCLCHWTGWWLRRCQVEHVAEATYLSHAGGVHFRLIRDLVIQVKCWCWWFSAVHCWLFPRKAALNRFEKDEFGQLVTPKILTRIFLPKR